MLDTLANSVHSECSFSATNHIHTKERNRHATAIAELQTLCYINSKVLYCLKNSSKQAQKRWANLGERDRLKLDDIYLEMCRNK